MPMHDWTRVDANPFRHFHGSWIFALCDVLNRGIFPPEYYTLTEEVAVSADMVAPRAQRCIQVRHNSTHRVVALIEIVSPANKASARDFRRFVEKAVDVLRQGLHLLVIDPFPPTSRDPNGIHAAVWKALTKKPFALPPDKPLTLASYAAEGGDYYAAYVEPIAVGDELPVMPLFLGPETYVNVPLEPTYRQAWDGFPEFWRAVVRGEGPAGGLS